jgi:hypothetical protein
LIQKQSPRIVLAILLTATALSAHHAFAPMFDGNKVIQLKGVVQRIDWTNPHTFIVVDVTGADGKTEQWALEGPAPNGLTRRGYSQTFVKPGALVEACGYGLRDEVVKTDPASGSPRRVMSTELLILSDGAPHLWQDYGQRKCRDMQQTAGK